MRSVPLAYLLTWTAYGTWLPGDQRGWVMRRHGFQLPNPPVERRARKTMVEPMCELDCSQRMCVQDAIRRHCGLRGWRLHAVNCRSNHVHVVVTAQNVPPNKVIAQLKAWCTRELKARGASEGNISEGQPPSGSASEGQSSTRSTIADQSDTSGDGTVIIERRNWWTERGSVRWLFDEASVKAAIQYVVEGQ